MRHCAKNNIVLNMKYLVLCMFCFGLFAVHGNAQGSVVAPRQESMMFTTPVDYHTMFSRQFDFNLPLKQSMMCQPAGINKYPSLNHLPGMFCKLEYKIETKSILAPRFRLGSLAYSNWMEGKVETYQKY